MEHHQRAFAPEVNISVVLEFLNIVILSGANLLARVFQHVEGIFFTYPITYWTISINRLVQWYEICSMCLTSWMYHTETLHTGSRWELTHNMRLICCSWAGSLGVVESWSAAENSQFLNPPCPLASLWTVISFTCQSLRRSDQLFHCKALPLVLLLILGPSELPFSSYENSLLSLEPGENTGMENGLSLSPICSFLNNTSYQLHHV